MTTPSQTISNGPKKRIETNQLKKKTASSEVCTPFLESSFLTGQACARFPTAGQGERRRWVQGCVHTQFFVKLMIGFSLAESFSRLGSLHCKESFVTGLYHYGSNYFWSSIDAKTSFSTLEP